MYSGASRNKADFDRFVEMKRRLGQEPEPAPPDGLVANGMLHVPAIGKVSVLGPADGLLPNYVRHAKKVDDTFVGSWPFWALIGIGLLLTILFVLGMCGAFTPKEEKTVIKRAYHRAGEFLGFDDSESCMSRSCSSPLVRYGGTATVLGSLAAAATLHAGCMPGKIVEKVIIPKEPDRTWLYCLGFYGLYEIVHYGITWCCSDWKSWLEYLSPLRMVWSMLPNKFTSTLRTMFGYGKTATDQDQQDQELLNRQSKSDEAKQSNSDEDSCGYKKYLRACVLGAAVVFAGWLAWPWFWTKEIDNASAGDGVLKFSAEPEVTDGEPAVTEGKPEVTEGKPAVTEGKPEEGKSTEDGPNQQEAAGNTQEPEKVVCETTYNRRDYPGLDALQGVYDKCLEDNNLSFQPTPKERDDLFNDALNAACKRQQSKDDPEEVRRRQSYGLMSGSGGGNPTDTELHQCQERGYEGHLQCRGGSWTRSNWWNGIDKEIKSLSECVWHGQDGLGKQHRFIKTGKIEGKLPSDRDG